MLVDDALNLARAGLLDYDTALSVIDYLPAETEYAPWAAFKRNFDYLAMFLRGTDKETDFNVSVLSTRHESDLFLQKKISWEQNKMSDM